MKKKGLYAILIITAFVASLILSFACLFTVKFAEVKFQSISGGEEDNIIKQIDTFKGRNLLLLSTDEVKTSLKDFHGYKVISLNKGFPNKLFVVVKERKEVFAIDVGGKFLIVDEEGYIIRTETDFEQNREIVVIKSDGLVFNNVSEGQVVGCSDDELLFSVMEMAKSINCYNCIKSIMIERATEKRFAYFNTYTGVILEIPDATVRSLDKIDVAFNEYDNCEVDYLKSFNTITVTVQPDGHIKATWKKNIS